MLNLFSDGSNYTPGASHRRIDWLFEQYGGAFGGGVREFVRNVNRAYYRHSAQVYDERNVRDIAEQYADLCTELGLRGRSDLVVVDIGGGTGFEYEQLRNNSVGWKKYFFIEPDAEMIRQFQQKHQTPDSVVTLQGTFEETCDRFRDCPNKLVVINSCLHHIIWVEEFLQMVKQTMQPGDTLLLCHEPNNAYARSGWLLANYLWRSVTSDLLLRRIGLKKAARRRQAEQWQAINDDLLAEKTIRSPLKPLQIRRIIDYWVGSKGDWKGLGVPREFHEGFWTPDDVQQMLGSEFQRTFFKTYRHLGDAGKNRATGWLNRRLQGAFPASGSVFCLALTRRESSGQAKKAA